jgi:heavy metal sensor kinase
VKPKSFRLRIALQSATISGLALVAFCTITWLWMHHSRIQSLDREIRALAYRHPGWMGGRASYEQLSNAIAFIFGDDRPEQLLLLVADDQGHVRYQSPNWPKTIPINQLPLNLTDSPHNPDPTPITSPSPRRGPRWATPESTGRRLNSSNPSFTKTPRFITLQSDNSSWRAGILGNESDRLILALSLNDLHADLNRMLAAFATGLPLALLGIALGGWWIAGRALKPLHSIATVAERVTARGLDQRIPLSGESHETTELIHVLNGMIDRLEKSFQQATRFSADASHELKTPLAIMQGELENALQSSLPDSPEQKVYSNLLEETQRLKSITRSLLLLARADAGPLPLQLAPTNLSQNLTDMMEDIQALAEPSNITVNLQTEPTLFIPADWPLLRQAISNLLLNALRYNQPNGSIQVALSPQPNNQILLLISNTGPGIPQDQQPLIFERFYRGDTARNRGVDGLGLGLSLAQEIIRAHHGSLTLHESTPSQTTFAISLPNQ